MITDAAWNSCSTNAGDKCVLLGHLLADADLTGLARNTFVADVDIVTACGEINTGARAQGDIAVARGVLKECRKTLGRVVAAGGVEEECLKTLGHVVDAGGVAKQRKTTSGRVLVAGRIESSAPSPVAVLLMPVVLLSGVTARARLWSPVVLALAHYTRGRVQARYVISKR
jgi:hypothetical protein